jgi:hypothetical protein
LSSGGPAIAPPRVCRGRRPRRCTLALSAALAVLACLAAPTAAQERTPTPSAGQRSDGGGSVLPIVAVLLLAAAGGGVQLWVLRRRARPVSGPAPEVPERTRNPPLLVASATAHPTAASRREGEPRSSRSRPHAAPLVRAPPDPRSAWTAEIEWRQSGDEAQFFVVARSDAGGRVARIATSPALSWPPAGPAGVRALTDAAAMLEPALLAAGWSALPPGEPWYAKRFAWAAAASAPARAPTPPKGRAAVRTGRSRSLAGERLRAPLVFAGVAVAAFMVARALGGQPFGFALVFGGAVVVGTSLFLSERYVVSLGFLLAYLALADGFLKLKYGGNAITVVRDVLLLAVVAGASIRLAVRKTEVTLPEGTGLVLAWVVVVLVQLFNPANGTILHSVQALRQQIEFVPFFFFGFAVMRTKDRLRGFFFLLLVVTAINAVVAYVQYQAGPEAVAAWGPGYAEKINGTTDIGGRTFYDAQTNSKHLRPFGLGSDTGFGGNLAVLAAPAAWAFIALTRRRVTQLVGTLLAAGVVLAALTSQTRLALIGAVVAFVSSFAFAVANRRAVVAIVALLVFGAIAYGAGSYLGRNSNEQVFSRYSTLLGPGAVGSTVTYKRSSFSVLPQLLENHPLGAGFGSAGAASSTPGAPAAARVLDAENEFNFLVIETGLPGVLVLLTFHLWAVIRSIAAIRHQRDSELRLLLAGIAAPLVAMLVMWFGGPVTSSSPTGPFLWFAAGTMAYWATVALPSHPTRPAEPAKGSRNVPVRRREARGLDAGGSGW